MDDVARTVRFTERDRDGVGSRTVDLEAVDVDEPFLQTAQPPCRGHDDKRNDYTAHQVNQKALEDTRVATGRG